MATDVTIPYWGYFGQANTAASSLDYNPDSSPQAQQFLAGLRHYDPNAHFVQVQMGESGSPRWELQFDQSKLPGGAFPGVDLNQGAYDPMYGDVGGGHNAQGTLKNPSGVNTSSVYGSSTPSSNWQPPSDAGDAFFRMLGLAGVGAFGFGIPYLASAMSNGAIGAGASAAGAGAAPLDTGGDSYLGLTNQGFPEFQGVPPATAGSQFDMGPWSGTSAADMVPGTGATGAGLTQAAAPITDLSTAARVGDVIRNGGIPGIDNLLQSAREFIPGLGNVARSLLPGGSSSGGGLGGGGNGLLAMQPKQPQPVDNITAILRRYYGTGLLGGMNG